MRRDLRLDRPRRSSAANGDDEQQIRDTTSGEVLSYHGRIGQHEFPGTDGLLALDGHPSAGVAAARADQAAGGEATATCRAANSALGKAQCRYGQFELWPRRAANVERE